MESVDFRLFLCIVAVVKSALANGYGHNAGGAGGDFAKSGAIAGAGAFVFPGAGAALGGFSHSGSGSYSSSSSFAKASASSFSSSNSASFSFGGNDGKSPHGNFAYGQMPNIGSWIPVGYGSSQIPPAGNVKGVYPAPTLSPSGATINNGKIDYNNIPCTGNCLGKEIPNNENSGYSWCGTSDCGSNSSPSDCSNNGECGKEKQGTANPSDSLSIPSNYNSDSLPVTLQQPVPQNQKPYSGQTGCEGLNCGSKIPTSSCSNNGECGKEKQEPINPNETDSLPFTYLQQSSTHNEKPDSDHIGCEGSNCGSILPSDCSNNGECGKEKLGADNPSGYHSIPSNYNSASLPNNQQPIPQNGKPNSGHIGCKDSNCGPNLATNDCSSNGDCEAFNPSGPHFIPSNYNSESLRNSYQQPLGKVSTVNINRDIPSTYSYNQPTPNQPEFKPISNVKPDQSIPSYDLYSPPSEQKEQCNSYPCKAFPHPVNNGASSIASAQASAGAYSGSYGGLPKPPTISSSNSKPAYSAGPQSQPQVHDSVPTSYHSRKALPNTIGIYKGSFGGATGILSPNDFIVPAQPNNYKGTISPGSTRYNGPQPGPLVPMIFPNNIGYNSNIAKPSYSSASPVISKYQPEIVSVNNSPHYFPGHTNAAAIPDLKSPQSYTTSPIENKTPKGRYTGGFGGAPGVLVPTGLQSQNKAGSYAGASAFAGAIAPSSNLDHENKEKNLDVSVSCTNVGCSKDYRESNPSVPSSYQNNLNKPSHLSPNFAESLNQPNFKTSDLNSPQDSGCKGECPFGSDTAQSSIKTSDSHYDGNNPGVSSDCQGGCNGVKGGINSNGYGSSFASANAAAGAFGSSGSYGGNGAFGGSGALGGAGSFKPDAVINNIFSGLTAAKSQAVAAAKSGAGAFGLGGNFGGSIAGAHASAGAGSFSGYGGRGY